MFSHVVIFWTKNELSGAPEALLAGAKQYLAAIPGIRSFHVGRMMPSHRSVVDQSYQVALNILFDNQAAQDAYQAHPQHQALIEQVFKPNCTRYAVFDFADA